MIAPDEYCREIESYLCRKNDGHLVRISGPAFERVSSWARRGIPLTVAAAGIDRCFERYYRRGPRRRPVHVEFCEADVLDAFDAWRRAVGISATTMNTRTSDATESTQADEVPVARRREPLATHIGRAVARLTALRSSSPLRLSLDVTFERVTRDLDRLHAESRHARGAARDAIASALDGLDAELLSAVRQAIDEDARSTAAQEAREAVAPFRARMSDEAYQRACAAAEARCIRDRYGIPSLSF
jgi:hypothetical protein